MFPVLFNIGDISIETYYVVWSAALYLALLWTSRRMTLYEIDGDEGRRIIAWGLAGMILGAHAVGYAWNFPVYWKNPSLLFDLNKEGISEKGAISGALIVTFALCRRGGKVSFFKLCEAAVIPGFLTIAAGRLGCFFAGCCDGIESAFPLALHFPYDDPSVTRHATQLYYSFSAALILPALIFVEKRVMLRTGGQLPRRCILTPLGLIFYSIMRISVDSLRLGRENMLPSNIALAAAIALGAAWFLASWNAVRKELPATYKPL